MDICLTSIIKAALTPNISHISATLLVKFFMFPHNIIPVPKTSSIECIGLVWNTVVSLAVCVVHHPPRAPADILILLKTRAVWVLEFMRIIVFWDFSIHADAGASQQVLALESSLAALGLIQVVYQVPYIKLAMCYI